jgi:soluble lytic murein transglycosylase-like protein
MSRVNASKKTQISLRRGLTAVLAALLALGASPARLISQEDQVEAVKQHRLFKLRTWLAAQDGGAGAAEALAHSITRESEKHALNPALVLAVIQVESRFDKKAVSPRGAQGLMQVKQVVVDELVDEGKLAARRHNLKDPHVNVEVGVSYLAYLIDMFGDVNIALTAYNSGPTRVREKLAAKQAIDSQYASKVLQTQRSVEIELAQLDSGTVDAG